MSDLPRLAEGTPANRQGEFEKLSNVRIERGNVHAKRSSTTDAERWWRPWEEYYAHPSDPPFLKLAECGDSDASIMRFLESCGTISSDYEYTGNKEIVFPVSLFRVEKWKFCLAVRLASVRRNPDPRVIRSVFSEELDRLESSKGNGVRGQWAAALRDVQFAIGYTPRDSDSRGYLAAMPGILKRQLQKMTRPDLLKAANAYLRKNINTRLRGMSLAFDIGSDGTRLYAWCNNLLDSFYWMLAHYLSDRKKLSACAHCGTVFTGDAKYCPGKPKCKERGRRLLDWRRNNDKYNRNRRRARRKKREAMLARK